MRERRHMREKWKMGVKWEKHEREEGLFIGI